MESLPTSPASSEKKGGDKAGKEFWDQWWKRSRLPPPIDPYRRGLKNYPFRQLHAYFEDVFKGHPTRGKKMIEVGCAQSVFLPYFSKYFGFAVSGLDRSELGCERSRLILERERVEGNVYCGDLFSPPDELRENFDVVISFGVIEHFESTVQAVQALLQFLRPGGKVITQVPNFTRLLGAYQGMLDRAFYEAHVPLDKDVVERAHRAAGLEIERCEYYMPIALEVLNVGSWPRGLPYFIIIRTHGVISRFVWLIDELWPFLKPNPWTSPYIHCVARKPNGTS